MRCSPTQVGTFTLVCYASRFEVVVEGLKHTIGPEEACKDFSEQDKPSGSAWTLADCTEVWTQFTDTVPAGLRERLRYADDWIETAKELRRKGSPCLASSSAVGDGVGSTTIRIMASWILAEEMGCDWVTPNWGRKHTSVGNGAVLYCHRSMDRGRLGLAHRQPSALMERVHCSVVDWLDYFQFGVPSVNLPEGAKIKSIPVR